MEIVDLTEEAVHDRVSGIGDGDRAVPATVAEVVQMDQAPPAGGSSRVQVLGGEREVVAEEVQGNASVVHLPEGVDVSVREATSLEALIVPDDEVEPTEIVERHALVEQGEGQIH